MLSLDLHLHFRLSLLLSPSLIGRRRSGSPQGVGVPYWPGGDDEREGDGSSDHLSRPQPSPLTPFVDFLDSGTVENGRVVCVRGDDGVVAGERIDGPERIDFEPTPFEHPVFIMFSSGTTGLPKCIVHGAGGYVLLQSYLRKETHSIFRIAPPFPLT